MGPGTPPQHFEEIEYDEATEARNLRISGLIEVALAIAILAVTALLVNAPPARSAENQPVSETFTTDELGVEVVIDPARAGLNTLHLTVLDPDGAAIDVLELEVTMTQSDRDIAPITIPVERLGTGHYTADDFNIPIRGEWTLITNALVDDTTSVVVRGEVDIR